MSAPKAKPDIEVVEGDWYEHPSWYDILHSRGTAREVDGLERIACRYVRSTGSGTVRWLEPGCGTGRYLRVAAARGIDAIGFDASPAMIEYATRLAEARSIEAEFFVASMEDFSVRPKADFAFCPINTIRHLTSDKDMLRHFASMARALKRGAIYAVGINTSDYRNDRESEDIWKGTRARVDVTQLVQYLRPDSHTRRERVLSQLLVRTPRRETHLRHAYSLRTYSLAQWLALLARSPFNSIAVTDEFGNELAAPDGHDLQSSYALWLLQPR